jgi:hypothetical protein
MTPIMLTSKDAFDFATKTGLGVAFQSDIDGRSGHRASEKKGRE